MNRVIDGILFDGETLAGRPVSLTVTAGRIHSIGESGPVDALLTDLHASDRLGELPRFLYFPGGLTVVTMDNLAVDSLLAERRAGRLVALIHFLEGRYHAAAAATVLLVASVALAIGWALPVLAQKAAMSVPVAIEEKAGQVALATIDQWLAPSQLSRTERERIQAQTGRLAAAANIARPPTVIFRSMGGQFPNAFALPGGLVIVSDELVRLATEEELAAVLAHEIGHLQHRHGMQSVLRNSTALLVVSTVTGDLSTLTTFASTIPFLLLQRGYSRELEAEADAYALDLLRRADIDPRHFRSILHKLEKSRPQQGNDFTYLSTHPDTEARIKALGALPLEPPPTRAAAHQTEPTGKSSGRPGSIAAATLPPFQAATPDPDIAPPRVLFQQPPVYPAQMMTSRLQGSVTVEFIIDEEGHTRDLRLIRSTYKEFEAPALEAIRQWRFEPARKDGRPISQLASQRLDFSMDGESGIPLAVPQSSDRPDEP